MYLVASFGPSASAEGSFFGHQGHPISHAAFEKACRSDGKALMIQEGNLGWLAVHRSPDSESASLLAIKRRLAFFRIFEVFEILPSICAVF